MPKYRVRSIESRVYTWEVEADDAQEAEDIVTNTYAGDTSEANSGDEYHSTEIMDVEEIK